jgi:type III restriction enzyme
LDNPDDLEDEKIDRVLNENSFFEFEKNIDYTNFLNRACFWMATGSGKTVVIVKLIELLYNFMKNNIIPNKHILVIAPNDKLIEQIKKHITIFNKCNSKSHRIFLKDLKDFEKNTFAGVNSIAPNEICIYYTRSSLISDENKENMFDYKSYIFKNGWYLILDEAHKGEQENSKRKTYINILGKNGFIFNFSATFTDLLDEVTTIYNFNLAEFIKKGYGKNIKILDDEFKNFKAKNKKEQEENLEKDEKIKIIIKSFIVFTILKKIYEKIETFNENKVLNLDYHNPLMVTLSNEINTKEADMKLYFHYISKLAKTSVDIKIFENIKEEIVNSLKENLLYVIGEDLLSDSFIDEVKLITQKDILKYVFYADSPSEIEVNEISGNKEELTFKLKTSEKIFALINASDIAKWKKDTLENYIFIDDILSESRFLDIHKKKNEINILMGSRKFIEGWDSNRPNIINFINMGVGDENTKLVLQAIGRGVRIEPKKNVRKRLIKNSEFYTEFDYQTQQELIELTSIIETLFIFATNKQMIKNIIEDIDGDKENWVTIKGINKTSIKKDLIVPVYDSLKYNNKDFKISNIDYNEIDNYIKENSEKLLILRDDFDITNIHRIKKQVKLTLIDEEKKYDSPKETYKFIEKHFTTKVKELIGYRKEEKIDIEHYKKIQLNIKDSEKIMQELKDLETLLTSKLNELYSQEQKELIEAIKSMGKESFLKNSYMKKQAESLQIDTTNLFENISKEDFKKNYGVELRNIEKHYYNPILISKDNNKYKHIIKEESEIEFLDNLEKYISNNILENIDWWYFSKIDEIVDNIFIPYFDSEKQEYRNFYPVLKGVINMNLNELIVNQEIERENVGLVLSQEYTEFCVNELNGKIDEMVKEETEIIKNLENYYLR